MAGTEVEAWASALLLKIHAITGWQVPQNEILNILADQFQKKMVESYPDVNTDEIEYAFRTHCAAVEDWGKQMNLSLIDKIMGMYLSARAQVSKMEEAARKPEQVVYTDEQLQDMKRGWTEEAYQRMRAGRQNVVPDCMREMLVVDGFVKEESEITEFLVKALNGGTQNLYAKC